MTDLDLDALVTAIVQRVAELPDRTSPDDWPEAMIVTAEELRQIVTEESSALLARLRVAEQIADGWRLSAARHATERDALRERVRTLEAAISTFLAQCVLQDHPSTLVVVEWRASETLHAAIVKPLEPPA